MLKLKIKIFMLVKDERVETLFERSIPAAFFP